MAVQRPLKEGSVRTYQEKVALGFPDILANEMDADLDTIYAAWNGGPAGPAGGDLSGTYPNPTVAAAAKSKWTDTGTVLTPTPTAYANKLTLDGAGKLTVAGDTHQFGTRGSLNADTQALNLYGNKSDSVGYNAGLPTWIINIYYQGDQVNFLRNAVLKLRLDGNGDLLIAGNTATKNTGTTWANPSDGRLKRDVASYDTGLQAILALNPIAFKYNGKGDTTADDRECWGLVAQDVLPVMPEMVTHRQGKLEPDDAEETDILGLDTSNVTLVLINAVKELAARVGALEARGT